MAIDFPSSPTDGQTFIRNNAVYTWVAAKSRWDASVLKTALPRNLIVNPAFQISQQNGNNTGSASGFFVADQWMGAKNIVGPSITGSDFQRGIGVRSALGSSYSGQIAIVIDTPPSINAADYIFFYQPIEGNRLAGLQFGTANAQQLVLRFSATISNIYATNLGISLRNNAADRSYVTTVQLPGNGAFSDWVIVIPGCTTGTWLTDNGYGLTISFTPIAGTTYKAPSQNAWVTGNFLNFTQSTSFTTNWVFSLYDVGLYLDPLKTGRAPPFEILSYRQDVFDSQRYWQRCSTCIGIASATTTATPGRASYPSMVPTRVVPAVSFVGTMRGWDQATAPNITAITTNFSNTSVLEHNFTAASAQTAGRAAMVIDVSPTIYMAINAR
jgi:hypothetical protein